jgi:hypothetical protein
LKEIRDDKTTRDYLVYIGKDENKFWSEHNFNPKLPFMIPAISERPAIYGLPGPQFSGNLYYWPYYDRGIFETGSANGIAEDKLLQEAKRLGFKGYIDLTKAGWKKVNRDKRSKLDKTGKGGNGDLNTN